MLKHPEIHREFESLDCCVIIPTYNNQRFLKPLVEEVLEYTSNVLVINDGSTDKTEERINELPVESIHFKRNMGKGYALRKGFKRAFENGYRYAITIDSDAQHKPADFSLFLKKVKEHPDSIIIGARNMNQDGIPGKSSFGHRFSNFWFKLETGISMPDTQSGFRLYPLEPICEMNFFTRRYEFEIEVIVRAAWRGISMHHVPIHVDYNPGGERISHFRPFIDFSRVSILNAFLVPLALLYHRPRMFIRNLSWKKIKEFTRKELLMSTDSNLKLTFSVMLGIFMGIVPIWGWQMLTAVSLAFLLRLNKVIVLVTSNISIPPMIPLIIYLSYKTGGIILGDSGGSVDYSSGLSFEVIKNDFYQYVIGALIFGAALSVTSGFLTFIILSVFRKKKGKMELDREANAQE